MEIKNLKKVADRIKKAIKGKENIILYSDADLDGTVSLLILEETIKNLNGKTILYFPERGIEGYGLNENALKFLGKRAPALLILLDSGIGNFKEVAMAKKMGFEVIIIDHHEILKKVPRASMVVNPKQKGDKYPFKLLATCGLSFKLALLLLGNKLGGGRVASKYLEQSFLELVALGTLADMMPQVEDNQIFIEKGLSFLPSTFRPGLQAFLKFFPPENFSLRELAGKIISLSQITDLKDHLTESYLLLSTSNEKEAQKLLEVLSQKNSRRRELLGNLAEEIKEKVAASPSTVIFEGGPEIPQNLVGAIASRICSNFKKPTFIYSSNGKLSRGSIRTPRGVNGIEALTKCSSLLEVYGGHPEASGFTVKAENLEKFKQCLEEYFEKL